MEWRRSIDWSSPRTSEGSSVAGGMAKSSLSSTFAVAIVAELAVIKLWVESIDVIEYGFSEDATLSRRRFSALYFQWSWQSWQWLMAVTFYQITILYYRLSSGNSLDSTWHFLANVQNEIRINKQYLKIASYRPLLWFSPHQNQSQASSHSLFS